MEELFEAVDLIDEFVVGTSGEWSVWVGCVFNEITGVNMEGEALLEEFGQDVELVVGGLVEPFASSFISISGCLCGSFVGCVLFILDIGDVINHSVGDVKALRDKSFNCLSKDDFVVIFISGNSSVFIMLEYNVSSGSNVVNVILDVLKLLGHG